MKQLKPNRSWKHVLGTAALALALSACGNPVVGQQSPPGQDNSADGKVLVENKTYTEAEVRAGIQCYRNSSVEGVKQMANQFETTLNAAVELKSRGLNIQYETALQALVTSMLLFDRTNNQVDCMN